MSEFSRLTISDLSDPQSWHRLVHSNSISRMIVTRRGVLSIGIASFGAMAGLGLQVPLHLELKNGKLAIHHNRTVRFLPIDGYGTTARSSLARVSNGWRLVLARARLPGMAGKFRLTLDFRAVAGTWMVRASSDRFAGHPELRLESWLSGETPLAFTPTAHSFPGKGMAFVKARANGARLALSANGNWLLLAAMDRVISFSETPFQATSLTWVPPRPRAKNPRWDISTNEAIPMPGRTMKPVTLPDGTRLQLSFQQLTLLSFSVGQDDPSRLVFAEGSGALAVQGKRSLGHLALQRLRFVSDLASKGRDLKLLGDLGRNASHLDFTTSAMILSGNSGGEVAVEVRGGKAAALEFAARLSEISIGISGASRASWRLASTPISLTLGALQAGATNGGGAPEQLYLSATDNKLGEAPKTLASHARLGRQHAEFHIDIDRSLLRVLRATDLLDLKFGYSGFRLVKTREQDLPWLEPVGSAEYPPMLVVHFPSQHTHEQATELQADAGGTINSNFDGFPEEVETRASGPTRIVFQVGGDRLNKPWPLSLQTLLQWKDLSMVVSGRAQGGNSDLQDQLAHVGITPHTNRERAMQLIRAAIEQDRDFDDPTPRSDQHFQTAIEPIYRLILSPSAKGAQLESIETHQDEIAARGAQLWSARLMASAVNQSDNESPRSQAAPPPETNLPDDLRVVWVRGVNLGFLWNLPTNDTDNTPPWDPASGSATFVSALSMGDMREMMTMTSVFGLMALRALVPIDKKTGGVATEDTVPTDLIYQDAPSSQVVGAPGYQLPIANKTELKEEEKPFGGGFAVARTLGPTQIILTPFGAHMRMDTNGEPFAPYEIDDPDKRNLNWGPSQRVERVAIHTALGRVILVTVCYKGFLFPFGHRASFLKVTERGVFKHGSRKVTAKEKDPSAYLFQRRFIVIGRPQKKFPALGQPFAGRGGIAKSDITLLTTRTPDLRNPEESDTDEAAKAGAILLGQTGLSFWPRITKGEANQGSDVGFEFTLDGEKAVYTAPQLFVDNAAVHDKFAMEELVKHYRNLPEGLSTQTAQGSNLPHAYAPAKVSGDTSYKTRQLVLTVSGLSDSDATLTHPAQPGLPVRYTLGTENEPPKMELAENFLMTARMEGDNQAPFFAVLKYARAQIQTLDRFTGRQHGEIRLRPNAGYVMHGFDPVRNPSELILDVLDEIHLDLSSDGTASGGIAKPNSRVTQLSRSVGIAGGVAGSSAPPGQSLVASTGDSVIASAGSASAAGRFDPMEFLGGAMSDAKLLGLISLKDVLSVVSFASGAPKMVEKETHEAVNEIEDATQALLTEAFKIGKTINAAWTELEKEARAQLDDLFGKNEFTFADFYPALFSAIQRLLTLLKQVENEAKELVKTVDEAAKAPENKKLQDDLKSRVRQMTAILGTTIAAVKTLIDEIEAVIDHPTPQPVDNAIGKLTEKWNALRGAVELQGLKDIIDDLKSTLETNVISDLKASLPRPKTNPKDWRAFYTGLLGFPFPSKSEIEADLRAKIIDLTITIPGKPEPTPQDIEEFLKELFIERLKGSEAGEIYQQALAETKAYRRLAEDIERAVESIGEDGLEAAAKLLLKQNGDSLFAEVFGLPLTDMLNAVQDVRKVFKDNSKEARVQLVSKLVTLIEKTVTATVEIGRLNEISVALGKLTDYCTQITKVLSGEIDGVMGKFALAEGHMRNLKSKLLKVKIPPQLAQIDAARAQALVSVDEVLKLLNEGKSLLDDVNSHLAATGNTCLKIGAFDAVSHLIRLKMRAVDRVGDLSESFERAIDEVDAELARLNNKSGGALRAGISDADLIAISAAISAAINDLSGAAITMIGFADTVDLTSIEGVKKTGALASDTSKELTGYKADLEVQMTAADAAAIRLNARFKAITDAGTAKAKALAAKQMALELTLFAVSQNKAFARLFGIATLQGNKTLESLDNWAKGILAPALRTLLSLDNFAKGPLSDLIGLLEQDGKPTALGFFVNAEMTNRLKSAQLSLDDEIGKLDPLAKSISYSELHSELLLPWKISPPAIVGVTQAVDTIADLVLKGQIGALFDFVRFRDALKSAIINMLPTKVSLSYDWATDIGDYPKSQPIFAIKTDIPKDDIKTYYTVDTSNGPLNIYEKFWDEKKKKRGDLVIEARASITLNPFDVKDSPREAHVAAYLAPSIIDILPDFPIVKLHMRAARFGASIGEGSEFNAVPEKIEICKMLDYIKPLQSFLSGGGPQGPYYEIRIIPLEIEVGYRFSIDVVPLGALMFYNIALSLSAVLPLDNRDARFRFRFASAKKPFIISVPPYGGGGFVGFTANTKGITGFEASIEFGAMVGLDFALIKGYGQITAGIYIARTEGGTTIIRGFVRAYGEGNISIFQITVNIEIGLEQIGNHMTGYARYAFSFKVGFVSYGFEFGVTYAISGGAEKVAKNNKPSSSSIRIKMPSRTRQWRAYRSQYAADTLTGGSQ